MTVVLAIAVFVACLWAFTYLYLRGENLARYDRAPGSLLPPVEREPSSAHFEVLDMLKESPRTGEKKSFKQMLPELREYMDQFSENANMEGVTIQSVDVNGVPGEWVTTADSNPDRRLLYIHGGGFMLGSALSHRAVTINFARRCGVSVLAIDYRLLPEHSRLDCVEDCDTAYRWILDNGPQAVAPVKTLFVAGDSAGGNLTLVTIARARDAGLKPADAVVAIAPATDATFSSPSIVSNMPTEHMLAPAFGWLAKVPSFLMLWVSWFMARVRPSDPRVSPLRGDLHNLPPTLIHVSEAEILLDDGRRYVNKATEAGSSASLETWHHMVHVWHIFEHMLPEAKEAFDHIERFLELHGDKSTTS